MTQSKKALSVFLSFVLALAMVPSFAFAAENEDAVADPSLEQSATQEEPEAPGAEAPEADQPEAEEPEAVQPEQDAVTEEPADQAEGAQEQEAAPTPAEPEAKAAKSAAVNARSTYNVSDFKITVNDGMIYTGGYLKPAVTIVDPDGIKLVKGVDYTLTYANNKKKGKGSVTIKMRGEYTGSAKVTFVIGSWKKFNGKWRFGYQSGRTFYCFKKQFATINGKTYRFNASGYRLTGWQNINGYRYRFNTSGVMQKGLITVSGSKYYMNPDNGRLRTGWWTVNGKLRYFRPGTSPKGKMYSVTKSGAVTINGYRYYYINNGTNDYAVKNAWYGGYYYGSNGRWTIVKPEVYVECVDGDMYDTPVVGFYLYHESNGGTLTIQKTGGFLWDPEYYDYDRDLILVGSNGYDKASQAFARGTEGMVYFRTSDYSDTRYVTDSEIYFKFKYDGVMWLGCASYYGGFTCERA